MKQAIHMYSSPDQNIFCIHCFFIKLQNTIINQIQSGGVGGLIAITGQI